MYVLLPAVEGQLSDATVKAAWRSGFKVRIERWPASDLTAYARLLYACWHAPGDFLVLEQDIAAPAARLQEMARCSVGWCVSGYNVSGRTFTQGLGCTRFTEAFRRAYPWAGQHATADTDHGWTWRHWSTLDACLYRQLTNRGAMAHLHSPPVEHLHRY